MSSAKGAFQISMQSSLTGMSESHFMLKLAATVLGRTCSQSKVQNRRDGPSYVDFLSVVYRTPVVPS